MALEFLKNILGEAYTEDIDKKISEEIGKAFVAKDDFNAKNTENKNLSAQLKERDKQLEELKNSTGDMEALKKQIAELQQTNKDQATAHQAELDQIRIDTAIEKALMEAKAKNIKATKALLDMDGLKLEEDGTVKGLSEQIKSLTESEENKFLFDTAEVKETKKTGFVPTDSKDGGPNTSGDYASQLAEARKNGNTLAAIKIKQAAAAEGISLI